MNAKNIILFYLLLYACNNSKDVMYNEIKNCDFLKVQQIMILDLLSDNNGILKYLTKLERDSIIVNIDKSINSSIDTVILRNQMSLSFKKRDMKYNVIDGLPLFFYEKNQIFISEETLKNDDIGINIYSYNLGLEFQYRYHINSSCQFEITDTLMANIK
jgi:hypothetical protein